MSDENNIWERPLGLQGVWGSIIYDWLDELLPDDADLLVKEEVRHYVWVWCVCDVCDLGQFHILNLRLFSFLCIYLSASYTIDTRSII